MWDPGEAEGGLCARGVTGEPAGAFPPALEMTKISVHCFFVAEPVSGQKDALVGCWLLSNVLEKIPAHSRRCVASPVFPCSRHRFAPRALGGGQSAALSLPKFGGRRAAGAAVLGRCFLTQRPRGLSLSNEGISPPCVISSPFHPWPRCFGHGGHPSSLLSCSSCPCLCWRSVNFLLLFFFPVESGKN